MKKESREQVIVENRARRLEMMSLRDPGERWPTIDDSWSLEGPGMIATRIYQRPLDIKHLDRDLGLFEIE
jgi:hypothetical protein